MTTLLSDLFDLDLLDEMHQQKYVTSRHHDRLPYFILNYTPKAQYENLWNDVTRACRGLIVEKRSLEVVARPFEKFFNYDDTTNTVSPDGSVEIEVTDKVDGSLGIAYPDPTQPTGVAIATRGSFHSLQAEHATQRYQQSHRLFSPRDGWTYLYEIVYPENRVVVDYGRDDNLYLIGIRNIDTGFHVSVRHPHVANLPRTQVLPFKNFHDFIENWKPRRGVEGVVIHDLANGQMWKVKTEEYKEIHRLTFGMSARRIWEALQQNQFVDYAALPTPYLQSWALRTAEEILDQREEVASAAVAAWLTVKKTLEATAPAEEDARAKRKRYAEFIIRHYPNLKKFLFLLMDGKSIDDTVWKTVEPVGDIRPTLVQE